MGQALSLMVQVLAALNAAPALLLATLWSYLVPVLAALGLASARQQLLVVNGRRLAVRSKPLGEGGYALIYHATELPPTGGAPASAGSTWRQPGGNALLQPEPVAVKKILAPSEDRLALVQHEIKVGAVKAWEGQGET